MAFIWSSSYRGPCKIFAYTEEEAYAIVGESFAEASIRGGALKWYGVRLATKEEITAECLRRLTK